MHHRLALATAVLVAIGLQLVLYVAGGAPLPLTGEERALTGPDAYMRLLQVERLWLSGDWFDRVSPLTNFPLGETLHWTRPFDLLLLTGAAPLSLVLETPRDALYAWAVVLGPVLQVVGLFVLSWGTRPLLSDRAFVGAALLFCLLPLAHGTFAPARPDHHGLQLLIAFTQMMILLRALHGETVVRPLLAAGLVAGLGLWVSPEALLGILVLSLALGLLWLVHGAPFLAAIEHYFWGLALATVAGFLLDRPPGEWMTEEHDRISIVHVALTVSLAVTWAALAAVRPLRDAGRGGRLAAGLAGAMVPALVMLALFPRFFGGPFVDVDPRLQAEWFDHIREVKPLLSAEPRTLGVLVLALGPLLAALPLALLRLRHASAAGRQDAVLFLVAMAVPLPLALAQARWAPYVEIGLLLPWVLVLVAILGWERPWPRLAGRPVPLRVPAFVAVLAGPVIVATGLLAGTPPAAGEGGACPWPEVAPEIRGLAEREGRTLGLLTFVHQGPEAVWRTGQGVVGSPYQRNHLGILDTHSVLRATDMEEARRLLEERRIDVVVLCREGHERLRYAEDGDSLFARLMDARAPDWLSPLPLSSAAAQAFVLYRVAATP